MEADIITGIRNDITRRMKVVMPLLKGQDDGKPLNLMAGGKLP